MKLFAATLAAVQADHFRGLSYSVKQGGQTDNDLTISRGQTWRRQLSGYSGGCTQYHIDNRIPSTDYWNQYPEYCSINSNRLSCGQTEGGYIVTDIEDQLIPANNFCYGSKDESFNKPSDPFTINWSSCCWVPFRNDNNQPVWGGRYGLIAQIFDTTNNSPQVKLPPVWKIMAGCPAQTLVLNPSDLDGDRIKCRWATGAEGFSAAHTSDFGSITLDEDECILTYDGTKDSTSNGVKPIAIQVEDFDANGVLRSSMPLQFLATVWTPSNNNFVRNEDGLPYQYPALFPISDDHDDHEDQGRGRRSIVRRSVPDYCSDSPSLESPPTPAAGSVFGPTSGPLALTLKAVSTSSSITRFTYQSPSGMSCGNVDVNGEVTCTFTPSDHQASTTQGFCFQAEDTRGLQTERRCIDIKIADQLADQVADPASLFDIHDMLNALDPNGHRYENYGCTGVGNMDARATNKGIPIDDVDIALKKRKQCLRCAFSNYGDSYEKYTFDANTKTCGDKRDTAKRSFCECDKQFVVDHALEPGFNPDQDKYDYKKCQTTPASGLFACCKTRSFTFTKYNVERSECCADGKVGDIGTC